MRGRMFELPLKPLLHIAFVTAWCSVFQSCKPLSLFSFRVIFILLSDFYVGLECQRLLFFKVSANFLKQFLSASWLCKLFDKALGLALARGALAMCLQMGLNYNSALKTFSYLVHLFLFESYGAQRG